jgi:hypothetical protein
VKGTNCRITTWTHKIAPLRPVLNKFRDEGLITGMTEDTMEGCNLPEFGFQRKLVVKFKLVDPKTAASLRKALSAAGEHTLTVK